MDIGKVITAVVEAIESRPHVDGTTYVLCWDGDKIVCIHRLSLRVPLIPIIDVTEGECSMGLGKKKWERTLNKAMSIIKEHGKVKQDQKTEPQNNDKTTMKSETEPKNTTTKPR